jgi:serine/threonine protein kinase
LAVEKGDVFVLMTDGVYEFVKASDIAGIVSNNSDDLDKAVKAIVALAFAQGSTDNLTTQIIRIDELPTQEAQELVRELTTLPLPGILEARQIFDGYKIIRQIHASSRSHVYLAIDTDTEQQVVIKTPSIEFSRDPAYLERFSMEEWIAKRLNSPHVLKPTLQTRKRNFLYIATEYIEGQTLAQWMIDNPSPSIETVRNMIEQIGKGLRAFHRLEMLHQDLRPANIMIDSTGTLKLIDFGSTTVAGVSEIDAAIEQNNLLGTAQYAAPEYFLGNHGTTRSDLYSLGVVAYQLLTQKLPYGAAVARSKSAADLRKLNYASARHFQHDIPEWVDEAIKKAVHPNPLKRYDDLMEFVYDLRHPNKQFLNKKRPPLIEQNPIAFWQWVSAIQVVIILILLVMKR